MLLKQIEVFFSIRTIFQGDIYIRLLFSKGIIMGAMHA